VTLTKTCVSPVPTTVLLARSTVVVAAMVTDSSAVRIQRAVRAYMASRFGAGAARDAAAARADKHGEGSAGAQVSAQKSKSATKDGEGGAVHITPPAGGQGFFGGGPASAAGAGLGLPPTPYRAGRSPAAGSPVRKTPPGNCGLPPMTPGNGGVCGAEREQVLSAWKKGIENQVSIIHEQLIDSARKGSARSRSRSPPPGSTEKVSAHSALAMHELVLCCPPRELFARSSCCKAVECGKSFANPVPCMCLMPGGCKITIAYSTLTCACVQLAASSNSTSIWATQRPRHCAAILHLL